MTNPPSLNQIIEAQNLTAWELGNQVLYDLCKAHSTHETTDKIVAKTWLIGRAYAASIERRKNKNETSDEFYICKVAKEFKKSDLDSKLQDLTNTILCLESLSTLIEVHRYLTSLTFD